MLRSILFKEWTKIRQATLLYAALTLALLAFELVRLLVMIREAGALAVWGVAIERGMVPFTRMLYLSTLGGVGISIAQFAPEISRQRLKLTLHLPIDTRLNLLTMTLFGFLATLAITAVGLGLFLLLSSGYFAREILYGWFLASLPMLVAAGIAYLGTTWVLLEPTRKQRLANGVVALASLSICYLSKLPGTYAPTVGLLAFLLLALGVMIYQSLYRFKLGLR